MMNEIYELESLDDLAAFLGSKAEGKTRKALAKEFFRYAIYKNAEEWNKAVRLCEALAIIGWGEHEPVEAKRGIAWNGSPSTRFLNRDRKRRFIEAAWSKRKTGITMDRGSTYRHDSPDLPFKEVWKVVAEGRPPVFENYPVKECIQDVKLTEQRNWIPKNPILLGRWVSNCHPNSREFVTSVEEELPPMLNERMAMEPYGPAINLLVITYSLSWGEPSPGASKNNLIILEEDVKISTTELRKRLLKMYSKKEIEENGLYLRTRFEYGNFITKTGCMKIDMRFPREFSEQSTRAQQREFGDRLSQAVQGAIERLKKKKLDFDLARMFEDLRKVLGDWAD